MMLQSQSENPTLENIYRTETRQQKETISQPNRTQDKKLNSECRIEIVTRKEKPAQRVREAIRAGHPWPP